MRWRARSGVVVPCHPPRAEARAAVLAAAVAALLAGGCSEDPRTELVVVVDSDLDVPSELDTVVVEVETGAGRTLRTMGDVRSEALPRSVGVVWEKGPLEVLVRAQGLLDGAVVVEREVRTSFVRESTLLLFVPLTRACVGVACGDGQSCAEGRCADVAVDPTGLPEWTGTKPRIDGTPPPPPPPADASLDLGRDAAGADAGPRPDTGTPPPPPPPPPADAGMCVPVAEVCNGLDDDCNGTVDDGFDLTRDPANCGACGAACSFDHAAGGECSGSQCRVGTCEPLFGDCNGRGADGCEQPLTTDSHCGMCGQACRTGGRHCCPDGTCQRGC